MSNIDSDGRNLGEATAISVPDAVKNLPTVMPGDDVGRAEAIRKIREATGALPKSADNVVPIKPEAQQETVADEESVAIIEAEQEETAVPEGASPVSKRSLKADDLDEIIVTIDGEDMVLTQEELKRGAAFLTANNKRAEELAKERKSLEAEKAKWLAKAGNEVNVHHDEIAKRQSRNSQIDELLEYAYTNNYVSIKFNDGTTVPVVKLENERKANDLAIRRSAQQAEARQAEIEEARKDFVARQRQQLSERDPKILDRIDDIASYLERAGFEEEIANQLVNADARLVQLLDKARKYDNAINSVPEKKKASQTKVISRGSSRTESPTTPQGNSNVAKWQEVVRTAPQGSREYIEGLRNIRRLQRA